MTHWLFFFRIPLFGLNFRQLYVQKNDQKWTRLKRVTDPDPKQTTVDRRSNSDTRAGGRCDLYLYLNSRLRSIGTSGHSPTPTRVLCSPTGMDVVLDPSRPRTLETSTGGADNIRALKEITHNHVAWPRVPYAQAELTGKGTCMVPRTRTDVLEYSTQRAMGVLAFYTGSERLDKARGCEYIYFKASAIRNCIYFLLKLMMNIMFHKADRLI